MKPKDKHLVYYYRFKSTDGFSGAQKFHSFFSRINSKQNAKQHEKDLILFISDWADEEFVCGRLTRISITRTRRINVDKGDEWYEEVTRRNGIEDETYVLINLKNRIMVAEYKSRGFGIFPKYIETYFNDTRTDPYWTQYSISPLAVLEKIKKLIDSKELKTMKFNVSGNIERLLDEFGLSMGKVFGDERALIVAATIHIKYKIRTPMVSKTRIDGIMDMLRGEKLRVNNASVVTDAGYFKFLGDTILNDYVYYNKESDTRDEEVRTELLESYKNKKQEAIRSLSLREDQEIDSY